MTISVRISDPQLLPDLGDFLRRATCKVRPGGKASLEVDVPGGAGEAETRFALFVAAWRGLHPDVEAHWIVPVPARVPRGGRGAGR